MKNYKVRYQLKRPGFTGNKETILSLSEDEINKCYNTQKKCDYAKKFVPDSLFVDGHELIVVGVNEE